MNLCETCEKGKKDICKYFFAEFLESDYGRVTACPEYEEVHNEQSKGLRVSDRLYPELQDGPEAEETAEKTRGETDDRGAPIWR